VDVGEKHFSFTVRNDDSNEYVVLEYYQFTSRHKDDDLKELLSSNTLLQLNYRTIRIFYNNGSGVLIPERYYDDETSAAMLGLVAGDLYDSMPFFDEVPGMNLRNVYTIPSYLHELLIHHFPGAEFEHLHSGLLKKDVSLGRVHDRIDVIFYPELIITALWKHGKVHLIQCFPYETRDDVAYHLLNLCTQWGSDPGEIPVVVSGLVERYSALFASVEKYFRNVELDKRPEAFRYDEAFNEYPTHFFTPLFSLGLCGS